MGDLGSIPGLGGSPGGKHGNPLRIPAWRVPMDRGAWRAAVHGVAKSRTRLSDSAQQSTVVIVWLYLIHDLQGRAFNIIQHFTMKCNISCHLLEDILYQVKECLFLLCYRDSFIVNGCWIISVYIFWNGHLIFLFIMWWIYKVYTVNLFCWQY